MPPTSASALAVTFGRALSEGEANPVTWEHAHASGGAYSEDIKDTGKPVDAVLRTYPSS
jgi:hypothetical protein